MNAAPVRSVYLKQVQPLCGGRVPRGAGDCSVILPLKNISTETQAQSRLAVLCREVVGGRSFSPDWRRADGPSHSTSFFGPVAPRGTYGRMLALPLFAGADPRDLSANAKQEGTP